MTNIIDALIFAILTAAGVIGFSSLLMFVLHSDPDDLEAQQQTRVEYAFFGVAGIVVMFLMWYALS